MKAEPTVADLAGVQADLCRRLASSGVEEAALIAGHLAAEVTGIPRLELPLHRHETLDPPLRATLEGLAGRICAGEPLQYVLGYTEFMGLRIRTDARALIPRPETEGLVEHALAALPPVAPGRTPLAADVGTGTACIAIALTHARSDLHVDATDVSAEALALAAENVAAHGLTGRVSLRRADLLEDVPAGALDLVVSNPPYVTSAEWAALAMHVRDHEPRGALEAGPDGLAVIRRLAAQARQALRPGGGLVIETGAAQGPAAEGILGEAGFTDVAVLRDLTGRDRYVRGRAPCLNP